MDENKNKTDNEKLLPYQDTSLTFEERAVDLVSRMTLSEKQEQLQTMTPPAIPRLGIQTYTYWGEAVHGIVRMGRYRDEKGTSFPMSMGMAATWNPKLVKEIGNSISDEARGHYAGGDPDGDAYKCLSFWSPTINLNRDPRWGRAGESYGEDPYLTTEIGKAFVSGMQGDDDKYIKVISTLKHYALNNCENNRHNGSSDADVRSIKEYYTEPFKSIVEQTNIASIMISYNRVNGIPMAANTYMIDDLLRKTWGFEGYVVSDCGAMEDMVKGHKWVPEGWDHPVNDTEATALALKAGTDIDCFGIHYRCQIIPAMEQGLITEEDVDRALIRVFTKRMQTGEFDPPEMVPYTKLTFEEEIYADDHTALAEQAADEAVVLLKNEAINGKPILPLDADKVRKIVVIGDLCDKVELGDYSGAPKKELTSTPIEGLLRANPELEITKIKNENHVHATTPFLVNFKEFSIGGCCGIKEVISVECHSELGGGCVYDRGNKIIEYIKDDAWIRFKNIDICKANEITITTSAMKDKAWGAKVEVHANSLNGPIVSILEAGITDSWTDFQEFKGKINNFGTIIVADLYFVFKSPLQNIELSDRDIKTISESDAVIFCAGTMLSDAFEDRDRENLELPRKQAEIINEVVKHNPNTIVYIQSVGQVNVEPFKDAVPAILWCDYNGQAQGNAMGRILFGQSNPSGKLPFTWYGKESELADITDYQIRSSETNNGRTYQYFKGYVSYPFGHGLSYAQFEYSNLRVDKTKVTPNDKIKVFFNVKNASSRDSLEVAQLYIVSPNADNVNRPAKQLKAFRKVFLPAGSSVDVELTINASDLYFIDESTGVQIYDKGVYTICIGSSSDDIRLERNFELSGELEKKLKTLTVRSDKSIIYAGTEQKVTTTLYASMNDQSFNDLSNAVISYRSSNTKVAVVDDKGVVTPVGAGVCTITVDVTIDNITKSGSYPVVVKA